MSLFNTNKTRISYISTETGEKVYPVLVDVKKGVQGGESIQFVSSDINTGMLSVAFMLDNADYNVSGTEVICTIQRPDATILEIPCKHISNNVVEVYLGVNGTSQGGTYTFDFKVYKGGDKVVGTPILNYTVSQSISSDNSIEEDDRLPVLNNLIIQVNNALPFINQVQQQVGTLEQDVIKLKGQGGESILVEYHHTGNQEIHFTNIDWSTGLGTTKEPHGLTSKTEIMIVPNDWTPDNPYANCLSVPIEYTRCNNRITVVPNGVNELYICKNDGTTSIPVNTGDTSNTHIDCTKFHFEVPVPWTFENFPKDFTECTITSLGYVKAGGQYRYTRLWGTNSDGVVREMPYIGLLGGPSIHNSNATHCIYARQSWDVNVTDGDICIVTDSFFTARRQGYSTLVRDTVREQTMDWKPSNFVPTKITQIATYSHHYAYMSNNTIIRVYG